MKTILLRALALFLFLLALHVSAAAQCKPDCEEDNWSATDSTTVTIAGCGSNCHVKVFWKYRNACDDYCDVYFERFRAVVADSCNCSDSTFITNSVGAFLLLNPSPLPCAKNEVGCRSHYRVLFGGCWRRETALPLQREYKLCDSTPCCITSYTICRMLGGAVTVVASGPPTAQPQCTGGCFEACGYMPGSVGVSKRMLRGSETMMTTLVVPNPASGVTEIRCSGADVTGATLELYDMAGTRVLQYQAQDASSNHITFRLDVRILPVGAYRFRVVSGTEVVGEGPLTVTR